MYRYHFWVGLLLLVNLVPGQDRSLVSKSLSYFVVEGDQLVAWNENYNAYSQIDLFKNPIEISTYTRDPKKFLTPALGWKGFQIGQEISLYTDTSRSIRLTLFNKNEDNALFDFKVQALWPSGDNSEIKKINSLLMRTLEVQDWKAEGQRHFLVFGAAGLVQINLPAGSPLSLRPLNRLVFKKIDTQQVLADTCLYNSSCAFKNAQPKINGENYSAESIEIWQKNKTSNNSTPSPSPNLDPADTSALYLLVGSGSLSTGSKGLRWSTTGDSLFFPVKSLGLDTLSIKSLSRNPQTGLVFAVTTGAVFFSGGDPQNWTRVSTGSASHDSLLNLSDKILLAHTGDSTWIYWDFPGSPGLSLFDKQKLQLFGDEINTTSLLQPATRLDQGIRLSSLTSINSSQNKTLIAAAQNRQAEAAVGLGLYYLSPGLDSTWKSLDKKKKIQSSLREVITYPTVFRGAEPVQIGYTLSKSARVSIEVFNYAMEPVKTLVRRELRTGGVARSENVFKDRWDGTDKNGHSVAAGIYYIRVSSDKGETGWGKALVVNTQ